MNNLSYLYSWHYNLSIMYSLRVQTFPLVQLVFTTYPSCTAGIYNLSRLNSWHLQPIPLLQLACTTYPDCTTGIYNLSLLYSWNLQPMYLAYTFISTYIRHIYSQLFTSTYSTFHSSCQIFRIYGLLYDI